MKKIVFILMVFSLLLSCKNEQKNSDENLLSQYAPSQDQSQGPGNILSNQPSPTTDQTPVQVNIPAGADGIVHHYICADKCKGGHSPNSGNCPGCGKPLAHNQAWHNQDKQQNPVQQNNNGQNVQLTPPDSPKSNQPSMPQQVNIPAGADGIVHHYICQKGCAAGKSETAGNCPGCGNPLAHNQAWHNK